MQHGFTRIKRRHCGYKYFLMILFLIKVIITFFFDVLVFIRPNMETFFEVHLVLIVLIRLNLIEIFEK